MVNVSRGAPQRRAAALAPDIDINILLAQKQIDHCQIPFTGRTVQGCHAPLISCVHINLSVAQEQSGVLVVPICGSNV